MPTINGKACVVDGNPVDKVFSNGRQVYGRNLLTNSSTAKGWLGHDDWTVADDKYNGLTVFKTSSQFSGLYQRVKIPSLHTAYTWSAWAKLDDYDVQNPAEITIFWTARDASGNTLTYDSKNMDYQVNSAWNRVFFTLPESSIPTGTDSIGVDLEKYDSNDKYLYICGIKLESGNTATPWTPAPEDVMQKGKQDE